MIFLDICKKNFDRIWHKGLLAKLPMFGLYHTLIKWIGSFFSDRLIAISLDGFWLPVENLIRFDRSVMTYKILNKLSPESLWG